MKSLIRCIAAACCLLPGVTGCGQKGPLYLPGDADETQSEIPQQAPDDPLEDDADSNADDEQEPVDPSGQSPANSRVIVVPCGGMAALGTHVKRS